MIHEKVPVGQEQAKEQKPKYKSEIILCNKIPWRHSLDFWETLEHATTTCPNFKDGKTFYFYGELEEENKLAIFIHAIESTAFFLIKLINRKLKNIANDDPTFSIENYLLSDKDRPLKYFPAESVTRSIQKYYKFRFRPEKNVDNRSRKTSSEGGMVVEERVKEDTVTVPGIKRRKISSPVSLLLLFFSLVQAEKAESLANSINAMHGLYILETCLRTNRTKLFNV